MKGARHSLLVLSSLVLAGCIEFSPFETDLDASERDHTRKNLARLEARPEPSGAWKLACISDSHSEFSQLGELVDILNERRDLELVLHAGDLTDYGLRQEYRWALEQLGRLRVPWLTTIGNHDALSNGIGIYRQMFGSADYVFDWAGVRFVIFNSNRLEFGPSVPSWQPVEDAVGAPPVLLMTHVAPNTAEFPDPARFAELMRQPGVLASVHGHLHAPSRRDVGPSPSVVIGSAQSLHYLVVTLDGEAASIERCRGESCGPLEPPP